MAVKVKHYKGEQPASSGNGRAPITAVLYARVSSEEQRERQTIQTQIDYARQWVAREGMTLIEIYADDGVSGTVPFPDRPSGKRLLEEARRGRFNTVLVYKLDRIGRETLIVHLAKHDFERIGISVLSLTEPFDTSTVYGRFMFGVFANYAELERQTFLSRSRDGTLRIVREGKWACGRPPYGYMIGLDGRLAINETLIPGCTLSEADVVRHIFRWVAEERLPLLSIAARLNEMGVPTSSTTEGRKRKLRKGSYLAGVWQLATLSYILHRTTYKGEHEYGRLSKKPDRELITQTVPAIISPPLWEQAQDALRRNLQWAKRNTQREYLLSGLIQCGFCGKRFQAATIGPRKRYYTCGGTMKHNRVLLGTNCQSRRLPLAWIEDLVWEELKSWILNHQDLEAVMAEALQEQEEKRQEWVDSLTRVKKDLSLMDAQRARTLTAYRKGLMSDAELEEQLTELKVENGHLQQVAEELEKRLSFTVDLDSAVSVIRQQLEVFYKALHEKTVPFPIKRKIVETFVNEVVVSLERGSALRVTLKETIPFRPEPARRQSDPEREGNKATLWKRDEATRKTKEQDKENVQILYRFPFPPQPKTLGQITFTTAVSIELTPTPPCCGSGSTTRGWAR
ncbi:MAG: recombinase family protein [Candidatus Binatia bacterium]